MKTNSNISHKLAHFFFPPHPPMGNLHRIVFVAMAFLLTIFELIFVAIYDTDDVPNVWLVIFLGIVVAVGGQFGFKGELAIIATFFLVEIAGLAEYVGFPFYAIYAISVVWIIRTWYIPALLLFFLNELALFRTTTDYGEQIFSSVIAACIVICLGVGLRWLTRQLFDMEGKVQKLEKANEQIHRDLASHLHDTVAKDLTKVAISAQQIADEIDSYSTTKVRMQLGQLADMARLASRSIRPLILDFDSQQEISSVKEVVQNCQKMLQLRSIDFRIDVPEDIDEKLSQQQILTVGLVVREGATNILKYAPSNSFADLIIEFHDVNKAVDIVMTNPLADNIDEDPQRKALSGGFGLGNLHKRVVEEGGTLTVGQSSSQWILQVSLPIAPALHLANLSPEDLSRYVSEEYVQFEKKENRNEQ